MSFAIGISSRARTALLVLAVLLAAPAQAQTYGFAAGNRLPVFTFHGEDGVQRSTEEFRGRWFLFKRGADWCAPCLSERPSLDAFMRAHPEIPVVMLVATSRNSPAGTDRQLQMLRDAAYQRTHGFDPRIVSVQDGRRPGLEELPAPKEAEAVPLTAVIDPNGVIAALWTSTYQYERFHERRGNAEKPRPRFREYVEAVLTCKGAALSNLGDEARALARSLDAGCS